VLFLCFFVFHFFFFKLLEALSPMEQESKKFECSICNKRFKRKWNCDRHFEKRHSTKASFSCVFSGCDLVFDTADSLGSHQENEHGLDTSSAQKRAKIGVVHDDHYDLMLPSGMLLHMGEHGVEERLLGQDGAVVTDG
jgi:hypothetical protein